MPDDWRESIPQRLEALAESWRDPAAWTGDGALGPEVEPADDATPMQRLIAMNGRDPHWAA